MRRLLNIYLALIMLFMTACDGYKDAVQEAQHEYEQEAQVSTSEPEVTMEKIWMLFLTA